MQERELVSRQEAAGNAVGAPWCLLGSCSGTVWRHHQLSQGSEAGTPDSLDPALGPPRDQYRLAHSEGSTGPHGACGLRAAGSHGPFLPRRQSLGVEVPALQPSAHPPSCSAFQGTSPRARCHRLLPHSRALPLGLGRPPRPLHGSGPGSWHWTTGHEEGARLGCPGGSCPCPSASTCVLPGPQAQALSPPLRGRLCPRETGPPHDRPQVT